MPLWKQYKASAKADYTEMYYGNIKSAATAQTRSLKQKDSPHTLHFTA